MNRVWTFGSWLIAAVVAAPIVVVLLALVGQQSPTWSHLRETVLTGYVVNTAVLAVAVGGLSAVIGIACAWTVATRDFPGKRFLSWALVLPLATPAYVVAYVYTDLLEFAGPVQSALRAVTGWEAGDYAFPPIRSLGGAALMLSLVLYPYVYLLARTAFETQAASLVDAARVLGAGSTRAFYTIALPASRPVVAGGVALAMMETVADYGVVDYFGVSTFTTGILRTWFALGDRAGALQLAGWLFIVVAALIVAEQVARRGGHANPVAGTAAITPAPLKGLRAWLATAVCALPLLLGLVVPMVVLARYAVLTGDPLLGRGFGDFVTTTFGVAGTAAVVATALALVLAYSARLDPRPANRLALRTATLGYALPGAVLAVGVLAPLTVLDKSVARFLNSQFDLGVGLVLTGTAAALVYAYLARFLTVAYNACQGGLDKVHRRLDDAARTLGAGPRRVLREVHVPLMRGAVASAVLLVFIDVTKELPATLILRPFNFETLATRVYRLASDERLAEASTAALAIIALGLLPALVLGLSSTRLRGSRAAEQVDSGKMPG
ncbi:MAG: iron ABC transporter permease [Gammaproteobacteria bacterium]|nr:iron ABC transporter permease [Gammaproteobacteria bacterium]